MIVWRLCLHMFRFLYRGFYIFQPRKEIYPYYFVCLAPPRAYSRLRASFINYPYFVSSGPVAFVALFFFNDATCSILATLVLNNFQVKKIEILVYLRLEWILSVPMFNVGRQVVGTYCLGSRIRL